jgi:CBS domain protein
LSNIGLKSHSNRFTLLIHMTDAIKDRERQTQRAQRTVRHESCLPNGPNNATTSDLPKKPPGQPISDGVAEQVDSSQIFEFLPHTTEAIDSDATVVEAAAKMKELNVGILAICNKGTLEGVITDRDIIEHLSSDKRDPLSTRICEIMTRGVLDDQDARQGRDINADAADSPPDSDPVRVFLAGVIKPT